MTDFKPTMVPRLKTRLRNAANQLIQVIDANAPDVVLAHIVARMHRLTEAGTGSIYWDLVHSESFKASRARAGLCCKCNCDAVAPAPDDLSFLGEPLCMVHAAEEKKELDSLFGADEPATGPDNS